METISDVIKKGRTEKAQAIAGDAAAKQAPTSILEFIQSGPRYDANSKPETPPAEELTTKVSAEFQKVAEMDGGIIIGVATKAEIVDKQDEVLPVNELVKMAQDFCASPEREFRINHETVIKADLVSSFPGAPIYTKNDAGEDVITGIDFSKKGEETHWFVGVRPDQEALKEHGGIEAVKGFSWGGTAKVTTKAEPAKPDPAKPDPAKTPEVK